MRGTPLSRVAQAIKQNAREAVDSARPKVATVISINPLTIEIDGTGTNPEISDQNISAWVLFYDANYGIKVDDRVLVVDDGDDWIVVDIIEIPAFTPLPGTPGGEDGGEPYVHIQSTPSSEWVIEHNLGYNPGVTVVDSGGTRWFGGEVHDSINQVTLTFSAAFSGRAYLGKAATI